MEVEIFSKKKARTVSKKFFLNSETKKISFAARDPRIKRERERERVDVRNC